SGRWEAARFGPSRLPQLNGSRRASRSVRAELPQPAPRAARPKRFPLPPARATVRAGMRARLTVRGIVGATALVAVLAGAPGAAGFSNDPDRDAYTTNGLVAAFAQAGGTTYVGGSFTTIGPRTGGLVRLSPSSGGLAQPFPEVGGTVSAFA